MVIVAVASSKGGVGKTTVSVNLATGLARQAGGGVLLVDLDPGAHATTWLLGARPTQGIAEAVMGGRFLPTHTVEHSSGLEIAPASPGLDGLEAALARQFGKETLLARLLARAGEQWEYVVLDCPPSVGFLTQSAIYASTHVLTPVLPGYLGLAGVMDIRALVAQVRERGGSRAELLGSVVFGADDREGITEQTRESLREIDPDALFRAEVRLSTAAKRLPHERRTSWDAGADPRGLDDYTGVLRETRRRLGVGMQRGAR